MSLQEVTAALDTQGWFKSAGAYVLVDGQYGSTGKGAVASILACTKYAKNVTVATTNNAPNAGHTAVVIDKSVVLKQLPIFPLIRQWVSKHVPITYINAGAVVNMKRLHEEIKLIKGEVWVDPIAAVVSTGNVASDQNTLNAIASTGQGSGPALVEKISRLSNKAVVRDVSCPGINVYRVQYNWERDIVMVEVPQGFSLGVNQLFYPYCTSRECTVMQGIADANIPAQKVRKVAMSLRTFPIRVGNTKGSSGECYPDQEEIHFDTFGVEPERTTVTNRVRRVFTFSKQQFREAVLTNQPDVLFVGFADYFTTQHEHDAFFEVMVDEYRSVMGKDPLIIGRDGPSNTDCYVVKV